MKLKKRNILIIIGLVACFFLRDALTLDEIIQYKEELSFFAEHHPVLSVLIFIISCVFLINMPLPLAALIKITGGFLFGVYAGIILNIIATTLGAFFGYFIVKKYLFKSSYRYFGRYIRPVEEILKKNGFSYFLALRVMMIFPYFLIHIIAGLSRVRLSSYLISTVIGVIPGSVIYALAGSHIESLHSPHEVLTPKTLLIIALMVLLSLTPLLAQTLQRRLIGMKAKIENKAILLRVFRKRVAKVTAEI